MNTFCGAKFNTLFQIQLIENQGIFRQKPRHGIHALFCRVAKAKGDGG
jgi:hypothetical protein